MKYDIYGEQGGISSIITLPEGFDPAKEKCPMMVLMHGFMAKKSAAPISYLAKFLAKNGIASIRFDFNAHGKSEGKFQNMTISNEISDAKAVFEYASRLPYVSKTGLLGHSQGGVVAGMLAGKLENEAVRPFCLIQLAPAAVLKDDAIAGRCMGFKYNPADPPEYVNIFMHKLGRKFILEAQKLPIFETSALYSGKVCIIHGTKDKIVPVSYSEKHRDSYRDSEIHLLEGEGHFMSRQKKEVCSITTTFLKQALE